MTDTTKLAERIEALEGPCRLTDANIHWRIRRHDFDADQGYADETYCYAQTGWSLNRADLYFLNNIGVPHYTASLDAAMTLYKILPERVPSDPRAACAEALRQWGEGE